MIFLIYQFSIILTNSQEYFYINKSLTLNNRENLKAGFENSEKNKQFFFGLRSLQTFCKVALKLDGDLTLKHSPMLSILKGKKLINQPQIWI